MARPVYETLCPAGSRMQTAAKELAVRLAEVVRLLLDAEEDQPGRISHYRTELAKVRTQRDRSDAGLMQHVAHCTDGCVRATGGALAFAGENQAGVYRRAPSHQKPALPGTADLAARIRDGATAEDLAVEYERDPHTIRQRLTNSGFSAVTGEPNHREHTPITALALVRMEDQPWAGDALCAQTDPEAFYPEKGESTREAKAVCASCLVQAECLDYALDHDERFGVWGGLSERERRRIKKALTGSDDTTQPLTTQESA